MLCSKLLLRKTSKEMRFALPATSEFKCNSALPATILVWQSKVIDLVPEVECRRCHKIGEARESRLPEGWWYTKLEVELAQHRGKPTCQDCLGTGGLDGFLIVNRRELYRD
jgi:hypothetical protein